MNIKANFIMIKEKGMDITNGQTIDDSKVGGTTTNSTDLACISVQSRQTLNLDYGKWENG